MADHPVSRVMPEGCSPPLLCHPCKHSFAADLLICEFATSTRPRVTVRREIWERSVRPGAQYLRFAGWTRKYIGSAGGNALNPADECFNIGKRSVWHRLGIARRMV